MMFNGTYFNGSLQSPTGVMVDMSPSQSNVPLMRKLSPEKAMLANDGLSHPGHSYPCTTMSSDWPDLHQKCASAAMIPALIPAALMVEDGVAALMQQHAQHEVGSRQTFSCH